MIDITSTNLYFTTHFKNDVWLAFPIVARTAAVASARRLLSKALGRAMNDDNDWADYTEGDVSNEGAAVAEQAIFLLSTSRIADGNSAYAPYPTAMPTSGPSKSRPVEPEANPRPLYSEDALRWLCQSQVVSIVRG